MEIQFSIVVPAYNSEHWITRALDSVERQSFGDYEIVVVDDGSQDRTAEVAEAWFARRPHLRHKLIRQANKGIGGARNAAMAVAEGQYLAFLDSDDEWFPAKLAEVSAFLAGRPEVGLVCHSEQFIEKLNRDTKRKYLVRHGPFDNYRDLLFQRNTISTSAVIVRAEIVKSLGGFSEDIAINGVEDYDLWLKIARDGHRIAYLDQVLGVYYIHLGGTTQGGSGVKTHHLAAVNVLNRHWAGWSPKSFKYALYHRRRLARIHRSAGVSLLKLEGRKSSLAYIAKSLYTWPLDGKNLLGGLLWLLPGIILERLGSR